MVVVEVVIVVRVRNRVEVGSKYRANFEFVNKSKKLKQNLKLIKQIQISKKKKQEYTMVKGNYIK